MQRPACHLAIHIAGLPHISEEIGSQSETPGPNLHTASRIDWQAWNANTMFEPVCLFSQEDAAVWVGKHD